MSNPRFTLCNIGVCTDLRGTCRNLTLSRSAGSGLACGTLQLPGILVTSSLKSLQFLQAARQCRSLIKQICNMTVSILYVIITLLLDTKRRHACHRLTKRANVNTHRVPACWQSPGFLALLRMRSQAALQGSMRFADGATVDAGMAHELLASFLQEHLSKVGLSCGVSNLSANLSRSVMRV